MRHFYVYSCPVNREYSTPASPMRSIAALGNTRTMSILASPEITEFIVSFTMKVQVREQCHRPRKNYQGMTAQQVALIRATNPTWQDPSASWFDGKQVLRFAEDDKFYGQDEQLRAMLIHPFLVYT